MGEKIAPAETSNELPWVKTLRDVLVPSARPTNGDGAEVPFTVEQAYFEQIIENAPEAISIIDEEVRILRTNAEFTRLFGFGAEEVAGKRLDHLIVPPDRYAETAWIAETIKTQSKISLETRRQRKVRRRAAKHPFALATRRL